MTSGPYIQPMDIYYDISIIYNIYKLKKQIIMKRVIVFAAMVCAVLTVSAQDKKVVVVDKFADNTTETSDVVDALRTDIIAGLNATTRLTVVDVNVMTDLPATTNELLKAFGEKGINYVIGGTLNTMTYDKDVKDGKTTYTSHVSYTLTVTDVETGESVASKNYTDLSSLNKTEEEAAIAVVKKAHGAMKKFVDENFKVEAEIADLEQENEKKGAVTVYVTTGSAQGIQKGQIFEVFSEVTVANRNVRKKIGELKAKEVVAEDMTLCEVKNGGKDIQAKHKAGVKMTVVSRAKKSLFDTIDKGLDNLLQ